MATVKGTPGDGANRTASIANYRNENVVAGGIPGNSFGRLGTPTEYAYFKMKLLETTHPSSILPRFFNRYTLPQNEGDTITFWRRKEIDPVDTPVPEGVYPAPKSLDYDQLQVKPRRYISWMEITLDAVEMSVIPPEEQAAEALGEQCTESTENIYWRVMVNGTHVRYAGSAGARNAVKREMQYLDVWAVCRDMIRREAQVIDGMAKKGTGSMWDTPQLETYAGFGHSDLEATLLSLQASPQNAIIGRDFTAKVAYGGGNSDKVVSSFEIGQLHRVRFFLHNRLRPFADAGGARADSAVSSDNATKLLSTGGVNIDVYPVPIIGKNALGVVGLEGYRGMDQKSTPHPSFDTGPKKARPSGKILINKVRSRDGTDPMGLIGSMGWMDVASPFIENDNWMTCIETGVRVL